MAYTTEQREALREAIASGATEVTYDGKTVKYRSLNDMRSVLDIIDRDLSATPRRSRSLRAVSNKGL
ncbi:hypothetical protein V5F77_02480 [Xanthobacter sp. DSM 24535]|uniref:phage head-tail joining protein n=1 Tax=Roseixanthobacter psychrophilus TaxID=3119917 RepID=UPI003727963F